MSVLVDNTGQSASGAGVASVTIPSFVVGAGPNRCIYLGVSQFKTADAAPSATFNGSENFVVHDSQTIVEGGGTRRVTILKLVNPSNVTADIVVGWGSAVDEAVCGADSWTNVDPTTPFGAAVKTSGSGGPTSSSVVVPNAAGDVVHDTFSVDGPAGAAGNTPNQTQRWRTTAGANTTEGEGQSAAGAGTNITCTWSGFTGGFFFAHIGVAIKQVAGAQNALAWVRA